MSGATRAGEAAFKNQEIAFSLCMAGVAVLVRDNPLYSPRLLWAFAALMGFNLIYHVVLRKRGENWYVPMISMAVNTVIVTGVVHLSGGPDSPFWPMYLIPIFTACLYLQARHVAFATASAGAFLAALYLSAAEPDSPLQWALAELTIKLAVLAVSAGVTAQYSFRERRARTELSSTRLELERLGSEIERVAGERVEPSRNMSRFVAGLVYDLNGRLTLIRGRAELLTESLPPDSPQAQDAKGIAADARSLSRLGSDLLRLLKNTDEEVGRSQLKPLVEQVLDLVEHRLRARQLSMARAVSDDLPEVHVGAPQLQQALLELLETATGTARLQGKIAVEVARRDGEVQIRIAYEALDDALPPAPTPQRRLLEGFDVKIEALGIGRSAEYLLHVPFGVAARRA